ncbi:MAG: permease [Methanomicrobiaceae archaeon]|nr:permease [Methanomicrobiaceae archaeon]
MTGQKNKGGPGGQKRGGGKKPSKLSWGFLAVVIVIYIAVAFIDPVLAKKAFGIFSGILMQVVPVLVFVFFLLFLTDLFIKPEKIAKYLGSESGVTGWLVAIVAGIISSGPIYVWFPFLSEMREKGMKTGLAATFLYNRAVKVPLLPLMIYYFGFAFTVVLTVYMIVFSVAVGFLTGLVVETGDENA